MKINLLGFAAFLYFGGSFSDAETLILKKHSFGLEKIGFKVIDSNKTFESWIWDSSETYIQIHLGKRLDTLEWLQIIKCANPPGYSISQLIFLKELTLQDSLASRFHLSGMDFIQSRKINEILNVTIGESRPIIRSLEARLNRSSLDSIAQHLIGSSEKKDGYLIAADSLREEIKFGIIIDDLETILQLLPYDKKSKIKVRRPRL